MGRRSRARARNEARGFAAGQPQAPPPSARYTPPAWRLYRPRAHKVVGIALLLLGLAIVVINYVDLGGAHILPGGHQEGYFFLGLLIAGTSTWWFGWFDRAPDRR